MGLSISAEGIGGGETTAHVRCCISSKRLQAGSAGDWTSAQQAEPQQEEGM